MCALFSMFILPVYRGAIRVEQCNKAGLSDSGMHTAPCNSGTRSMDLLW